MSTFMYLTWLLAKNIIFAFVNKKCLELVGKVKNTPGD